MNVFRQVGIRLRTLFCRDQRQSELDQELQTHLELRIEELQRDGLGEDEARFQARREFGHMDSAKEACRDSWGVQTLTNAARDVRHALRSLRKAPFFAVFAVVTLGLGIGLTTTMFSFMNFWVLSPLHLEDKDELIRVWRMTPEGRSENHATTAFVDLERESTEFARLTAFRFEPIVVAGAGVTPVESLALGVSAGFFETLGLGPEIGRTFTPDEHETGAGEVVVIGHATWRNRFGGDPDIVGRSVRIDGRIATVVGVMPASSFEFLLFGPGEFFRPLRLTGEEIYSGYDNHSVQIIGRRRPGVSIEQADMGITRIFAGIASGYPREASDDAVQVVSLEESVIVPGVLPFSALLVGLAGAVLLIACGNLAGLQLTRAIARGREFALRSALGASRRHLVAPLMCECLVLAVVGVAFGLMVAHWGNQWSSNVISAVLPVPIEYPIDWLVLGFAFLISLVAGLSFGLFPAVVGSRVRVADALKSDTRTTAGSRSQSRFLRLLIVGQFALALVLLAAGGMFARAMIDMADRAEGWDPDGLLQAELVLLENKYPDHARRSAFFERLQEQLAALPGVTSVSLSTKLPHREFGEQAFVIEGREIAASEEAPRAGVNHISPSYLEATGTRLIAGRPFARIDGADALPVVIINESLKNAFFPDSNPLGRRIGDSSSESSQWMEIVGVVEDVRHVAGDERATRFQFYRPLAQREAGGTVAVAIRTSAEPGMLAPAVRESIRDLDGDLVIRDLATVRDAIRQETGLLVMLVKIVGACGLLGLFLATVGMYGVVARTVAQRTPEIGIRMALGAGRGDVLRLVAGSGARLALMGALVGFAGVFALKPILVAASPVVSLETSITDWRTLLPLTFLLLLIALLASYLPSRRATKIDPIQALRVE